MSERWALDDYLASHPAAQSGEIYRAPGRADWHGSPRPWTPGSGEVVAAIIGTGLAASLCAAGGHIVAAFAILCLGTIATTAVIGNSRVALDPRRYQSLLEGDPSATALLVRLSLMRWVQTSDGAGWSSVWTTIGTMAMQSDSLAFVCEEFSFSLGPQDFEPGQRWQVAERAVSDRHPSVLLHLRSKEALAVKPLVYAPRNGMDGVSPELARQFLDHLANFAVSGRVFEGPRTLPPLGAIRRPSRSGDVK